MGNVKLIGGPAAGKIIDHKQDIDLIEVESFTRPAGIDFSRVLNSEMPIPETTFDNSFYMKRIFRFGNCDNFEKVILWVHDAIKEESPLIRELRDGYGYKEKFKDAMIEKEYWKNKAKLLQERLDFITLTGKREKE